MKRKLKLAFDALEAELQKISNDQMTRLVGGNNYSTIGTDCVIEAIAFATGRDYQTVFSEYTNYMSQHYGGTSGAWGYDLVNSGINYSYAAEFAQVMGLTNVGDRPWGAVGMSVSGDQSVAFLNNGDGTGHAIVLTGNAGNGSYYYYDPQNGYTGTINANDSRVIQTYGY